VGAGEEAGVSHRKTAKPSYLWSSNGCFLIRRLFKSAAWERPCREMAQTPSHATPYDNSALSASANIAPRGPGIPLPYPWSHILQGWPWSVWYLAVIPSPIVLPLSYLSYCVSVSVAGGRGGERRPRMGRSTVRICQVQSYSTCDDTGQYSCLRSRREHGVYLTPDAQEGIATLQIHLGG
jgi:hypothetical protein